MAGRLVLVGTPIGHRGDLSPRAQAALREADVLYCEDTRSLRRLLGEAGRLPPRVSCHKDNERARTRRLLADLEAGRMVAYVSEAGMPGIRDPGLALVRAARDAGFEVDVVPGPSAVTCALAHAGFEGPFTFVGFAPRNTAARRRFLADLARRPEVVVLFEAPARVPALLRDLGALGPEASARPAVMIREMTKRHQQTVAGTVETVARACSEPLLGEVTIVLGPRTEPAAAGDDPAQAAARAVLDALTDPGLRPRARAKAVAKLVGMPAAQVYERLARTDYDEPA